MDIAPSAARPFQPVAKAKLGKERLAAEETDHAATIPRKLTILGLSATISQVEDDERPLLSASLRPGCNSTIVWICGVALSALFLLYGKEFLSGLALLATISGTQMVNRTECLGLAPRGRSLLSALRGSGTKPLPGTSEEDKD